MKIKPLILLLSSFLLVACSNGNQETAEKSFGDKAETTQTSKKSSSASKDSSKSKTQTKKSNEELYADVIASYPTEYNSNSHAFYDLNNDGVDEMFIGDNEKIEALYYIVGGVPQRLGYSYAAFTGSLRKEFQIFADGTVAQRSWFMENDTGRVTIFNLTNDGNEAQVESDYQDVKVYPFIPENFSIIEGNFDNSKLKWITTVKTQKVESHFVLANEHSSQTKTQNTTSDKNNKITPYKSDQLPSAMNPETRYRDGFYISPLNTIDQNTSKVYVYKYGQTSEIDSITGNTKDMTEFLHWIRETAPDGTTKNGLKSNYDYWVKNVK